MKNNRTKRGLLLSVRDSDANTPLHLACIYNHLSIVKLLIEFGADIDLTNLKDQNVFHICCEKANISILKYLFEISVNVQVDFLMIKFALESGKSEIVEFLISKDLTYLKKEFNVDREDLFDMAFQLKSWLLISFKH